VQEKLQESLQKLDLLKLALELRSSELPLGSRERAELEQELNLLSPSHIRQTGAEKQHKRNKNGSAALLNQIDIMTKPAELTGRLVKLFFQSKLIHFT